MSGLREAFDEIVADVPVYGDLDRAIEQAAREQRRRYGAIAGLAAAAAVLVVIAGLLAVSGDTDSAPPVSPTPTPSPTSGPTPTPSEQSQSPQTWADTPVPATYDSKSWLVPDPLKASRDAWFAVAAEHLDPEGDLEAVDSDPRGLHLEWPAKGSDYEVYTPATSAYPIYGRLGLMVDPGDPNPFDNGCAYITSGRVVDPDAPQQVSCRNERFTGPDGEPATVSSWQGWCRLYEGGVPSPTTCGDYVVTVAVQRRDGLIGYVVVEGRGATDFNPVTHGAMAAAAADPRLTLPERAFAVPSDQAVAYVVQDHFPGYRVDHDPQLPAWDHPGLAQAWGHLGALRLYVEVWPAAGSPACGRAFLVECVERRVFGQDDPTTVFVGAWDEEDWAGCCPRNSRADDRTFVYVGPRHTVVAHELLIVKEHEEPISADLDKRVIDLLLDPRLQ